MSQWHWSLLTCAGLSGHLIITPRSSGNFNFFLDFALYVIYRRGFSTRGRVQGGFICSLVDLTVPMLFYLSFRNCCFFWWWCYSAVDFEESSRHTDLPLVQPLHRRTVVWFPKTINLMVKIKFPSRGQLLLIVKNFDASSWLARVFLLLCRTAMHSE